MGKKNANNEKSAAEGGSQKTNIVNKIMKNKNKFRSGLGFKESLQVAAQSKKIDQVVSRKKILEGTKGDKTHQEETEEQIKEEKPQTDLGHKNRNFVDDIEEEENLASRIPKASRRRKEHDALFKEFLGKEAENGKE